MSYTLADLQTLDAAIASGELEVVIADTRIRFDSFQGLKARRDFVESQLRAAGTLSGARSSTSLAYRVRG